MVNQKFTTIDYGGIKITFMHHPLFDGATKTRIRITKRPTWKQL